MVNLLILVQSKDVLDRCVTCPDEVEVFTSLQHLEPVVLACVDDGVVNVCPVRVQETKEEHLDLLPSIVFLY